MSALPIDVIDDILSRLPVKPLLQFRSVSKPWCALIDSPEFIKSHLNRSIQTNTNLSVILQTKIDGELYSVDLDSLDNAVVLDHDPLKIEDYGTQVLGSCNGLLWLSNKQDDHVLWNPSTRKHQKLPVMYTDFRAELCTSRSKYTAYGFGYDVVSDDYKVVRVVQWHDEGSGSEIKVYSLKSNSWRRIQEFPYLLRYLRQNGTLASNALHWVVTQKSDSDRADLIAAFDLGVEEYRLVPQPEYSNKEFHMNLGVLGGCLYILCHYYFSNVDIWVMKEYGVKESWTKLFSVKIPSICMDVIPITYSKSGGEVLLKEEDRLLWYDLKNKTVKNVRIHGMPDSSKAYNCLGSLVPLKGDSGSDGKKRQALEKMKKNENRKKRDDFLSKGFKLVL